ncbi:MAG TPA: LysR family transcriptional regulator [Burkholderiaceae bacterium]|nr:LysR family transcriptional regulator [Burkholderiaceae bacterium]
MVDLKRLGHVVALADECHFARAAERVHLSQPAFSRSIQAIEREVGMQLFDRETGEVKLTPAGAFLVERARRLLFDARNLQRDAELYRDSQLGDTAFGSGPFPAVTILPRALASLRQRYPAVGLRVELTNWQLLYERLLAEDIEFFISDTRDLPPDPRIETASLGRQPGRLYARAGHPLAGRACRFAQAWQHGLAAIKLPLPVKAALGQLLELPPGTQPVLALECDDVALLRRLALTTDTVIAATDAAMRDDVQAGHFVPLRVKDLPVLYAQMGIVMLVNRTPSPMARHAMACIRAVAREINAADEV